MVAGLHLQQARADDVGNDYTRNSQRRGVEVKIDSRPDAIYVQIQVRQTAPSFQEPGTLPSGDGSTNVRPSIADGGGSAARGPGASSDGGRSWRDDYGYWHQTPDGQLTQLAAFNIGNGWYEYWRDEIRGHPGQRPYILRMNGQFVDYVWIPSGSDGSEFVFGAPPADEPATAGVPAGGGASVDPRQVALDVLAQVPMPNIRIRVNPGLGLVALPGWFWVEGFDNRPFGASRTVEVPPAVGPQVPAAVVPAGDPRRRGSAFTVDVRVSLARYEWSFGDGGALVTRSLGRAYPAESDIQHTYEYSSFGRPDGFPVTLAAEFAAEYRVDGGPAQGLPPVRRTYASGYRVQEAQAVLTGR
jgi:hypothetical protein